MNVILKAKCTIENKEMNRHFIVTKIFVHLNRVTWITLSPFVSTVKTPNTRNTPNSRTNSVQKIVKNQ